MYSDAVVERALAGRWAGDLERPDGTGEAGNPACGDAVRIQLELSGGRVAAARRRAFGCPHAVAAGELACELVEGRSLLDAARIGTADLEQVLEPAAAHRECVALAVDALHQAIAAALGAHPIPPAEERVAVAMSGGVDSAVALLKTARAGLQPVGVTLRLWIDPQAPDSDRACCSPASVRAARAACHGLGAPHVTLDLRSRFHAEVVDDFVTAHAAGRTPNPCMRCNGRFRFHELAAFADRIGATRLATGHYARIERRDGRPLVAQAADEGKDQSYMLAGVPPEILERVWFPLGDQPKTRTRAEARSAGLEAAERRESQEVCFVGGGDHRSFVERMGGGAAAGTIEDAQGTVLGRHTGVHRFTPGQRRGLGISSPLPLYVVGTDAATGRVTVGGHEELARTSVTVSPGSLYAPARRVQAKLRYRSPAVAATVHADGEGFRLDLDEPVYGVAPGQAAVLYDGAAVVGVGTIAG